MDSSSWDATVSRHALINAVRYRFGGVDGRAAASVAVHVSTRQTSSGMKYLYADRQVL